MWIRGADDLRRHLNDPSSRESHAFDYKKALDGRDKEAGRKIVKTICGMADADGGQVLIGIDEEDGVPLPEVVGVSDPDRVEKQLEQAMNDTLALVEPRPRIWVLPAASKTVVVVDVFPSVRLAALRSPSKRNHIMYPVRTGQGTDYMRPGDVEARILTYGPRAQRIALEHFTRRAETEEVALFTAYADTGRIGGRPWGNGRVRLGRLEEFGVVISIDGWVCDGADGSPEHIDLSTWIPYQWLEGLIASSPADQSGRRTAMLGLVVRARLIVDEAARIVTPIPV